MKTTIKYETSKCTRCGGTGMYGGFGVCFRCGGKRVMNTSAAIKALKAVEAFKAENFSIAVEDLKAGDVLRIDGKSRTVTGVETTETHVTASFGGGYGTYGFLHGSKVVKAVGGDDWTLVVEFARKIKRGVTVVTSE